MSENDRISSDIERDHINSKCSEYARTNDSEDGVVFLKENHIVEEEERGGRRRGEIHEVNNNNMDEEDINDKSITNYFDENFCIFNDFE